jgi:mannose-6-phosphate isomerase-like protein (cupin superfamily)
MSLFFSKDLLKQEVFTIIENDLREHSLKAVRKEFRPWGGFFVIDEKQASHFLDVYFSSLNKGEILARHKLSPKILVVESGKRLSWQYHHRRSELWKVVGGTVGIVRSNDDNENEMEYFDSGDIIKLKQGERHRLVGIDDWGVIAEIWQHTDNQSPSDEEDIIRLDDDFGR